MDKTIEVEVVFATRESQTLVAVSLVDGATAADAIAQSGILDREPGGNLQDCPIGVWGKLVDHGHRLSQGDRVEIYRRLEIDPREARRQLALVGRTMSQSNE